jgi:5-hydroxyisourate hydrolase
MGISTHILDTTLGKPAAHVEVALAVLENDRWQQLAASSTDADGRCKDLLAGNFEIKTGTYRLSFATAAYYATQQATGLYPTVDITFTVSDAAQHYHIPLLLTANGYTTYRGS